MRPEDRADPSRKHGSPLRTSPFRGAQSGGGHVSSQRRAVCPLLLASPDCLTEAHPSSQAPFLLSAWGHHVPP